MNDFLLRLTEGFNPEDEAIKVFEANLRLAYQTQKWNFDAVVETAYQQSVLALSDYNMYLHDDGEEDGWHCYRIGRPLNLKPVWIYHQFQLPIVVTGSKESLCVDEMVFVRQPHGNSGMVIRFKDEPISVFITIESNDEFYQSTPFKDRFVLMMAQDNQACFSTLCSISDKVRELAPISEPFKLSYKPVEPIPFKVEEINELLWLFLDDNFNVTSNG